jgi:methylmalonyl-CoA mutase
VVASALADLGFEVIAGPLFDRPETAARRAVEAKVDVTAVSTLAAAHMTLLPELKRALAAAGREDMTIVVGGVVPPEDVGVLRQMGAAAVFAPGTRIPEAALEMLERLEGRLGSDFKSGGPS